MTSQITWIEPTRTFGVRMEKYEQLSPEEMKMKE